MEKHLLEIVNKFQIKGVPNYIEKYGNGHINKTYLLKTDTNDYILQQINSHAFKDVDLLMNNISVVTDYIRSIGQESMTIIKTKDNELYYKAGENEYYRIYDFVMNTKCIESITDISLVDKDAEAFGMLHKNLAKLDASKLGETIPQFHDTPKRYRDLMLAIKEDRVNRLSTCLDEVNYAKTLEDKISLVVDGLKDGSINFATTHNDPKINNVLFDDKTGDVRCVIDLDTIMPGSILYDVGDSFRSLFTGCNESSTDLSLLVVDYDIFRHYVRNYLKEMKDVITPRELELIPYSAFLLTAECGMRFLEDYLKGDVYFAIHSPDENLIRCRTQFALAKDINNNLDKLSKIVEEEFYIL
ncbi:MAG: aminoglycoside phosphotransferase family protein [Bacilli bacterium]|nr:aminoglycoside phosphotransferase family protein [Bacilli bacterium]